MVKKAKKSAPVEEVKKIEEVEESESQIEDEESEAESVPSGGAEEPEQEKEEPEEEDMEKKFGQKSINDTAGLNERLKEIKGNFYNRLDSAKLIKR